MALTIKFDYMDAMAKALSDKIDQDILDTVTTTYPVYKDGTKLLRDAAQAAEDYQYKTMVSRRGWKTRYEIRNV